MEVSRVAGDDAAWQVQKPVRPESLVEAILNALGRGRAAPVESTVPATTVISASVLLVEDNVVNRLVASQMLERIGCRVDVACDGLEALEIVARRDFDLVLMDCEMPGMDGYETTRRMRASDVGNPDIPVVALTGNAISGERDKCLEAGMNDFLTKPVTIAQLAAMVRRWTARGRRSARRVIRGRRPPSAGGPRSVGGNRPGVSEQAWRPRWAATTSSARP